MRVLDDPKKIWDWYQSLKSDRSATESRWQEISDHEVGGDIFTGSRMPGVDRMTQIYDTTALYSNQLLAGTIHGLNTNPATLWAEVEPADRKILEDPEAAFWFDDSSRRLMQIFNAPESNFATQVATAYMDIPSLGGSIMGCHEGRNGIRFSTRSLGEGYMEEDDEGEVVTLFREQNLRAVKFVERYGREAYDKATEAVDKGNHSAEFQVIQLTTRNDHPYAGNSPFVKPWVSIDLMRPSSNNPTELRRGGFYTKPWMTPRWEVRSGEIYGRGPGWNALPDARMLNAMALTLIKYAQKATDPPILATHQAVIGGLRMHPGGVTYVQDRVGVGGSGDAVRTLDVSRARPEIGYREIEQRQQAVQRAFWSQLLQLFEHPNMTATQVLEMADQVMRLLGPMMGRIQKELIQPMLERVFDMMIRRKRLLPVPTSLRGIEYQITFISPLARAQRQSEADATMKAWQANAIIAQASQSADALDILDPTESAELMASAFSVPKRILRDVAQIQEERAQRAQLTEQAAAINESDAGARVLKTLSEAASPLLAQAA